MKIRNGFVSNSSSSSFVIVTTPEKWKEAKLKLAEKVGEDVAEIIVGEIGKPDKRNFLGHEILVFSGTLSSEEYGYSGIEALKRKRNLTDEEEEDLSIKAYEEQGELDKILEADGVSYTSSQCC